MRILIFLWLAIVMCFAGYLAYRTAEGIQFRTDLMALLPREEQDPAKQRAHDAVTTSFSKRIVILIGSTNPNHAKEAATHISQLLSASQLVDITASTFNQDALHAMGKLYFPYRFGLLSPNDRTLLQQTKGEEIATRALAQIYGLVGISDSALIEKDPFLLSPSFLLSLPNPLSRASVEDGMLTVHDNNMTWIMVNVQLKQGAFELETQRNMLDTYHTAVQSQQALYPDLQILHSGAVFFAERAASIGLHETSLLGFISLVGTILLLLFFFRSLSPLLLSLLSVTIGMMVALSACLLLFKELHISTLLFGTGLIGIAVDYSLQYCTEIFSPVAATPYQRLKKVLPAITLGMATTVIGYLTFLLAPFPGLQQVAVFSTIGLLGAWITLVLWLPEIDRSKIPTHGAKMIQFFQPYLNFWNKPHYHYGRRLLFTILISTSIIGFWHITIDDDVRHLQALPADLKTEQDQIQTLIGHLGNHEFFLIQGKDDETTLQAEELLTERLQSLVTSGELGGFQALSSYVPSLKRQRENQQLILEKLYQPLFEKQKNQLHLNTDISPPSIEQSPLLSLDQLRNDNASLPFLSMLAISHGNESLHVVMLQGIKHIQPVAAAATDIPGVHFINPVDDFSTLLGKYRTRACFLLLVSALFIMPLLVWRYGYRAAGWVMLPPLLAVILTPGLLALTGATFTFFDAMALILVFSTGVDYTVFYVESSNQRQPITMIAVTQSAVTTIFSFGLLAFSSVTAIQSFGLSMFTGGTLAFLLAPLASRGRHTKENRT